MLVLCTICGEETEITLEEFVDNDEYFCKCCSEEAFLFIVEMLSKSKLN